MKFILKLVALVLVIFAAGMLVRTLRFSHSQRPAASVPVAGLDAEAAAARLAEAVRFPTVSHQDPALLDSTAFQGFIAHLDSAFPRVHTTLQRETLLDLSLLYTWPGTDTTLAPVLLLSHYDVVPIAAADAWTHDPFGGVVAEDFVWGRGTLDDKVGVMGLLEAVEGLLGQGFAPQRTVLLAFGHDEEVGGQGAIAMAQRLDAQGVRPLFILDEGGAIAEGIFPGITAPVALIGTAEKGYLTLELAVEGQGGHSSMPPLETPVGILSRAVAALEAEQRPARIDGVAADLFSALSPALPFGKRFIFANLWLFEPVVTAQLVESPVTAALVRTTTAPTMLSGSIKENVLPRRATATVNFRVLPGETSADVVAHVRAVVKDERVLIDVLGTLSEPSTVSSPTGPGYQLIEQSLHEASSAEVMAVPFLVVGATDARHYAGLSEQVFRFVPFTLAPEDRARVHGPNERIAVADYATVVRFYHRLIKNASAYGPTG